MSGNILPPQPLLSLTGPLQVGFSQSALQSAFNGAAATVSQLALKVVSYIQSVIADAVNTGQATALKVATPIATGINQAQAVISQIGGQVQSQVQAGLNTATAPCAGGCAQEQGARPGQYQYNVWQDFDVPAVVAFSVGSSGPPSPPANWCFRGGWDDYYDAIKYKAQIQGSTPPPGCKLPGGVAAPPATPTPSYTGANEWYAGCLNGSPVVWDQTSQLTPVGVTEISGPYKSAQDAAQFGPTCSTLPPSGPPLKWWSGCDASGNLLTWQAPDGATNVPPNVSSIAGPFGSQVDAQAGGPVCGTQPPGGPPQQPPQQPSADCASAQAIKICSSTDACVYVDLCDWSKFEDALVRALCRWYKECVCKLTNEMRWSIADCDGELASVVKPWKGKAVAVATDNAPDDIIAMGVAGAADSDWSGTGNDPNPWR